MSITHKPTFNGNKTASAAGATNSDNITLSVDLDQFSEPGVYRYKLTDAPSYNTLRNAGVVRRNDYDPVRYADVYIERNSNDALIVKGYVVFDECHAVLLVRLRRFSVICTILTEHFLIYRNY